MLTRNLLLQATSLQSLVSVGPASQLRFKIVRVSERLESVTRILCKIPLSRDIFRRNGRDNSGRVELGDAYAALRTAAREMADVVSLQPIASDQESGDGLERLVSSLIMQNQGVQTAIELIALPVRRVGDAATIKLSVHPSVLFVSALDVAVKGRLTVLNEYKNRMAPASATKAQFDELHRLAGDLTQMAAPL